jgi:hypothetical protein
MPFLGLTQDFYSPDSSSNIIYQREYKYGIKVHTQGLGAKFSWGRNINAFKRKSYSIELHTLNNPKEQRVTSLLFYHGRSYIYGKINYIVNLRAVRLIEKQLNRKPYWRGVELRWFYQYGVDIAFAKPYYLQVYSFETQMSFEAKFDDPDISSENIIGRARFLKGIEETKTYPGIHFESGLSFDYGIYRTSIKELTLGASLDIYPFPIRILALNPPHYYFLTLFIGLNIGRRQ